MAMSNAEKNKRARERRIAKRKERQLEGQRTWCENNTPYGRVTFEEKREIEEAASKTRVAQRAATSKHVGEVGSRRDFVLTLKSERTYSTRYGTTTMYMFDDQDGNAFVWRASRSQDMERGQTYKLHGRIKTHSDWKGIAQTDITRCTVLAHLDTQAKIDAEIGREHIVPAAQADAMFTTDDDLSKIVNASPDAGLDMELFGKVDAIFEEWN